MGVMPSMARIATLGPPLALAALSVDRVPTQRSEKIAPTSEPEPALGEAPAGSGSTLGGAAIPELTPDDDEPMQSNSQVAPGAEEEVWVGAVHIHLIGADSETLA
jgi:hypothetical protein